MRPSFVDTLERLTRDLANVTRQILQNKTFGELLRQLPALNASSLTLLGHKSD
jgi:hypothetical protein